MAGNNRSDRNSPLHILPASEVETPVTVKQLRAGEVALKL